MAIQPLLDLAREAGVEDGYLVSQVVDVALRRKAFDPVGRRALAEVVSRLLGKEEAEPLVGVLRAALDARRSELSSEERWTELGLPIPLYKMISQKLPQRALTIDAA